MADVFETRERGDENGRILYEELTVDGWARRPAPDVEDAPKRGRPAKVAEAPAESE